jgi:hypothetical protein
LAGTTRALAGQAGFSESAVFGDRRFDGSVRNHFFQGMNLEAGEVFLPGKRPEGQRPTRSPANFTPAAVLKLDGYSPLHRLEMLRLSARRWFSVQAE